VRGIYLDSLQHLSNGPKREFLFAASEGGTGMFVLRRIRE